MKLPQRGSGKKEVPESCRGHFCIRLGHILRARALCFPFPPLWNMLREMKMDISHRFCFPQGERRFFRQLSDARLFQQ
ncbi:MAG: hypothetical protein II837_02160, partial [Treponema sp.]|nr:hypothetical protein [Treponema sp.]